MLGNRLLGNRRKYVHPSIYCSPISKALSFLEQLTKEPDEAQLMQVIQQQPVVGNY
jgi:hypothetical protein